MTSSGPRIGYLVKAFPVVSETFILNEVRAMEAHGVPLAVLALKQPPKAPVHRAVATLISPCQVAPWGHPRGWPGLLRDHLLLLARGRRAYGRAFYREVGRFLGPWLRRPSQPRFRQVWKRLRRFAWAGWVAGQVRKRGLVHLHAHYASEPLRVAHLVKRLVGVTYSFTAHAKDLYLAPACRLRRRMRTAIFATSCHADGVAELRRLAAPADRSKVRLVRHGLDLDLFRRSSQRSDPPRVSRILAVGRLTEKKGFDDLIDACATLAAEGLDFVCDIVGDGKLRLPLEERIRALGLGERIRLRGFVPQEELPAWHAQATIFVVPSKELADGNRDGVPNVLLEALASGLPVVATRAAGIPDVVRDRYNGLLTKAGDAASLAAAMARLLTEPALAADLGRTAAGSVESLDFLATNKKLAGAFKDLLALGVDRALDQATRAAWTDRGLARKAKKRLGLAPRCDEAVEAGIRRAVRPGLEANSWRDDLQRVAGRRLWDEAVKASRLASLVPQLLPPSDRSGARILDLGSGRGGLAVALRARGFDATAFDLRYRNCLMTRLRGRRYDLPMPAVNGIAEALPFADGSFDAVACLEVLEHVTHPARLLAEIRRVLTPRGRCVITVINRWAHLDPHYHLWGINFLPRAWAGRYIAWRQRTKVSYRDRQTLDEMHYYSYRHFARWASALGLRAEEPECPDRGWPGFIHRLSRWCSLGFNTVTLVLRPSAPCVASRSAPLIDAIHQHDHDRHLSETQPLEIHDRGQGVPPLPVSRA